MNGSKKEDKLKPQKSFCKKVKKEKKLSHLYSLEIKKNFFVLFLINELLLDEDNISSF